MRLFFFFFLNWKIMRLLFMNLFSIKFSIFLKCLAKYLVVELNIKINLKRKEITSFFFFKI